MRKFLFIIAVCVMIFSGFMLAKDLYGYYEGQKTYEISQKAVSENTEKEDKKPSINVDFETLKAENSDVLAWIYCKGTPVNYPVVQGDDNSRYLSQMYNLEWNGCGSIFVDYRCENPFRDFNTIVYGHRMKDKSMFGTFGEYRSQEYFDKHRTMELITPETFYKIKLFAVVTIPEDSDMYKMSFDSDSEKEAYLEQIASLNEVKSKVKVTSKDEIVMLSTCTYEYEGARLVVYGKLVEEK